MLRQYTKPIVIYDIEATCGDDIPKEKREVIEIGAVMLCNGKICGEFDRYIKPKNNPILTDYCKNLTHIKQESIDAAESFDIVFKEFMTWCDNNIMCSWTGYDGYALLKDIKRHKIHGLTESILHNKVNIKAIYVSCNKLGSKFKSEHSFSLEDALKEENIDFEGSQHRAIDDAKNTAMLYIKHRKRMDHILALRYENDAKAS